LRCVWGALRLQELNMDKTTILETLGKYKARDAKWREGRVWAGVYDAGHEAMEASKAAYAEFLTENALYINLYPSVLALENEVVTELKDLLRAPTGACGNLTSGGTESILLACKAARDQARAERGVTQPEIVLARTTHPAFHKAAHLLGMKVVITEFGTDFRAVPSRYAEAINANTVMLVGSAPCYSHGVVDPITELAALAQASGVWMHVDGCVGGLFLAHMRLNGMAVPDYDFSVPGVSSISADLHKYGYSAKGASCVLYRNKALRRYALYANAHTTGYALVNSTALSSRSGGPIAAAWATLHALGRTGYADIVRETMLATQRLREGVASIDGLKVLGAPAMCMFTVACESANVFVVEDEMLARGWHLQTQFQAPGTPANVHFSVNRSNVPQVEALLADLREAVAVAAAAPPIDIAPVVGQLMAAMSQLGSLDFDGLMAQLGAGTDAAGNPTLPERWATINTLLDALPDAVVDQLLIEYANRLYA
jgi:sphinganine-1-phosphate aldolase